MNTQYFTEVALALLAISWWAFMLLVMKRYFPPHLQAIMKVASLSQLGASTSIALGTKGLMAVIVGLTYIPAIWFILYWLLNIYLVVKRYNTSDKTKGLIFTISSIGVALIATTAFILLLRIFST